MGLLRPGSLVYWAQTLIFADVDHKYHYIRQEIPKGDIIMKKIGGTENLADPLTKIVSPELLRQWMKIIGMKVVYDLGLGRV